MKNLLIISPHFPPVNAPDMQRIRQSLPFYRNYGWNPIIVCSDKKYVEGYTDESLLHTIPDDIEVIRVKGIPYRFTRLFGLGNLGLRSFFNYALSVNKLLKLREIDLIFFSTTVFPLLALGSYWKRKFNIPYIIDMQDPWLDYASLDKPKELRQKKYWFMHSLDKFLEPIAMKKADGIISVTQQYIDVLKSRYKNIVDENTEVITFGYSTNDFKIAEKEVINLNEWNNSKDFIRGVYTGVVNKDMLPVIEIMFRAIKEILDSGNEELKKIKLFFIGTNYATGKFVNKMVMPLAEKYGIDNYIVEVTSRIPYLIALKLIREANFLLLIGSTNKAYTASKLYPYLYTQKPIFAIFNKESSVVNILKKLTPIEPIAFTEKNLENQVDVVKEYLLNIIKQRNNKLEVDLNELKNYSAEELTKKQELFFNRILDRCIKDSE